MWCIQVCTQPSSLCKAVTMITKGFLCFPHLGACGALRVTAQDHPLQTLIFFCHTSFPSYHSHAASFPPFSQWYSTFFSKLHSVLVTLVLLVFLKQLFLPWVQFCVWLLCHLQAFHHSDFLNIVWVCFIFFQIKEISKLKGSLEIMHSPIPSPDCPRESPGLFPVLPRATAWESLGSGPRHWSV